MRPFWAKAAPASAPAKRQRLNIARAFLKDAPVLLLDEPTSALDPENEREILEALERLMEGRTTLMVAHSPATVWRMPKVLVLEAGRVTGFAPPAELAAQNDYFARAFPNPKA